MREEIIGLSACVKIAKSNQQSISSRCANSGVSGGS